MISFSFIIFVSFDDLYIALVKIAETGKIICLRFLRKIIDEIFIQSFSLWISGS